MSIETKQALSASDEYVMRTVLAAVNDPQTFTFGSHGSFVDDNSIHRFVEGMPFDPTRNIMKIVTLAGDTYEYCWYPVTSHETYTIRRKSGEVLSFVDNRYRK